MSILAIEKHYTFVGKKFSKLCGYEVDFLVSKD